MNVLIFALSSLQWHFSDSWSVIVSLGRRLHWKYIQDGPVASRWTESCFWWAEEHYNRAISQVLYQQVVTPLLPFLSTWFRALCGNVNFWGHLKPSWPISIYVVLKQFYRVGFAKYLLTYSMEQSPSWEANRWTLQLVKKFPTFMQHESPSPSPQVPATCPYPEPNCISKMIYYGTTVDVVRRMFGRL
jgi:hypothetical protein